jgi:hypothetical protein
VLPVLYYSDLRTVFSHDEIANVLGVTSKSFEDTYEDKAKELKRTLLEYMKTLMAVTNSAGAGAAPATGSILFDTDGFPIAPNNLSDKTTKEDLEQLYHAYITQHYREFLLPRAVSLLTFSDRTRLPR